MKFIDVKIEEENDPQATNGKVKCREDSSFGYLLRSALEKHAKHKSSDEVHAEVLDNLKKRIKIVNCREVLIDPEIWDNEDTTLQALDSKQTPIYECGIHIILKMENTRTAIKPKGLVSVTDLLMGKARLPTKFLRYDVDLDSKLTLQEQVKYGLYELLKEYFKLGYCNGDQKAQLETNMHKVNNVACFIEKHWTVLLGGDKGKVLEGDLGQIRLLKMLSNTKRIGNKTQDLFTHSLRGHIDTISKLKWNHFTGNIQLKNPLNLFKAEIESLTEVLVRHRDRLTHDSKVKKRSADCDLSSQQASTRMKVGVSLQSAK